MRYKCVKNKLKNIVIDGEAEGIVKETVLTVHRIAIHALQFIKLFLLDHYETHGSTPTVTRLLVMNCMAVVRESKEHKNPKTRQTWPSCGLFSRASTSPQCTRVTTPA